MSGMDRLTDEEWAVQYLEDDAEACSAVNGSHDQTTKDARRMEVLVKRLIRERDDAHRRASQAAPAHEDDLAVDRFAAVMKGKLAKKRNDGRGGWSGPECSEETLSRMLRDHVGKGDPVDVANFAMMLHQRGERIAQAAPAPSDGLREAADRVAYEMWVQLETAGYGEAAGYMQTAWMGECIRAALSASPAQEGGE